MRKITSYFLQTENRMISRKVDVLKRSISQYI